MFVTVLASMSPVVLLSKVLRSEAATVVSLRAIAGSPKPVMPLEVYAVLMSFIAPVMLITLPALRSPVVLLSKILRSEAAIVVSLRVNARSPKPLMPLEASAVNMSSIEPVMLITLLVLMSPVVLLSKILRS